ncbi:hypothetical protein THIOM_003634 [Candidatus Thiomargarita nelsonii]|uniref:Uncharacterized protein n=1 Tax=Candidatus Thiomargarita nelsonii TaxID=1003181 RepID=A0A176RY79_9GAMM|nr:hypothetical protein THIOM_003634 [Candidatus Thiomargarita nelsonii]
MLTATSTDGDFDFTACRIKFAVRFYHSNDIGCFIHFNTGFYPPFSIVGKVKLSN